MTAGTWAGTPSASTRRRLYLPCTFPVPSLYLPCTLGRYALAGVEDAWSAQTVAARAAELNLEVREGGEAYAADGTGEGDTVVWSKWVEPCRALPCVRGGRSPGCTWWGNNNHVALGSTEVYGAHTRRALAWEFRFADGTERAASLPEVYAIAWAHWAEGAYWAWARGDMLVFNNQVVAHDATPGVGERVILPSFGGCFKSAPSLT